MGVRTSASTCVGKILEDTCAYCWERVKGFWNEEAANRNPTDEAMEEIEFSGQHTLVSDVQFERRGQECDQGIPFSQQRPCERGGD